VNKTGWIFVFFCHFLFLLCPLGPLFFFFLLFPVVVFWASLFLSGGVAVSSFCPLYQHGPRGSPFPQCPAPPPFLPISPPPGSACWCTFPMPFIPCHLTPQTFFLLVVLFLPFSRIRPIDFDRDNCSLPRGRVAFLLCAGRCIPLSSSTRASGPRPSPPSPTPVLWSTPGSAGFFLHLPPWSGSSCSPRQVSFLFLCSCSVRRYVSPSIFFRHESSSFSQEFLPRPVFTFRGVFPFSPCCLILFFPSPPFPRLVVFYPLLFSCWRGVLCALRVIPHIFSPTVRSL